MAKNPRKSAKPRKGKNADKPTVGDNSKNMDDASRQTLFLTHCDSYTRAQAAVDRALKKRKEVEKVAKEDGFSKKMLVVAARIDDPEKDKKLRAEVRTLMQVAVWKGAPINTQFDMFGAPGSANDKNTDKATAEGRAASAGNKPRKPPEHYAPEGPDAQAWLAGYAAHQKELLEQVGRGNVTPLRAQAAE